jgi:hypothetical protein
MIDELATLLSDMSEQFDVHSKSGSIKIAEMMLAKLRDNPSEAMIEAGGKAFDDAFSNLPFCRDDDRDASRIIFRAMINAALEES